jgi:Ca2+-binding EF-hand superfamily protein
MALANKRPGGVEVNIMANKEMGMDKFEPGQEKNPTKEDLETYRIVFELFDRDKSGFIDA